MQKVFKRTTLCCVGGQKFIKFVFIQIHLLYSLQTISKNAKERVPLICHLEGKLYDMYLPLKFHIKGRLELSDKLESGFYLIHGFWKGEFPFLRTLFNEKITTDYTVYTVDYSFGAIISAKTKDSLLTHTLPPQYMTQKQLFQETNAFGSEAILERTGSLAEIIVDKFLPLMVLNAFKVM